MFMQNFIKCSGSSVIVLTGENLATILKAILSSLAGSNYVATVLFGIYRDNSNSFVTVA